MDCKGTNNLPNGNLFAPRSAKKSPRAAARPHAAARYRPAHTNKKPPIGKKLLSLQLLKKQ